MNIDEYSTITWDPSDISGYITIGISTNGGKSFTPIEDRANNDGVFRWKVKGIISPNCVLKIEPVLQPEKRTLQGFFTITKLKYEIKEIVKNKEYKLTATYNFKQVENEFEYFLSDPEIAVITDNYMVQAKKNGRVILYANYKAKYFETVLHLKTDFDQMESEPNNITQNATQMFENRYMEGELLLDDVDYFTFSLPLSVILEIAYLPCSTIADVGIQIFDDSQNLLASGVSNNGENLYFPLGLTDGDYYIKLYSTGDIDQQEIYNLFYQALKELPEPGIQQIPVGGSKEGTVNHLQHVSQFSFDLYRQMATIHFIPSSETADYNITIKRNQDFLQKLTTSGDQVVSQSFSTAGKYFISVSPIHTIDAYHPFLIEIETPRNFIEVEPNDDRQTATPLNKNEIIKGALSSVDDEDFYSFEIQQIEMLNISFQSPNLQENIFLELYNANHHLLNQLNIISRHTVSIPLGLDSGNYYFKVSGSDIENQYNLKIEESTSEIEIEPNNQFQTASYLLIDNNITGYLPSMADIDIFQVNVSNPTSLTINFQCDDNENHYSLELYKQSSEILIVDQLIIPHNQFFQYPVRLDTGKYYLKLQQTESADTSAPYQIEILSNNNFVEMEPNNTYQDASMLQESEPTYGFLSSSEDIDFFDINNSETSYKQLIFECPNSNKDFWINIYKETDQHFVHKISIDNGGPVVFPLGLNEGTYYFRISGNETIYPYSIKIINTDAPVEIESNNTYQDATLLPEDIPLTGILSETSDYDFFTFKILAPGYYNLVLENSGSGNYLVSLYKDSVQYMINGMEIKHSKTQTLPLGLSIGRYYVKVSGNVINQSYKLTLQSSQNSNVEVESNNTIRYANALSQENEKQGRIFYADDIDYFGFLLAEPTVFNIDFNTSSQTADYKVSLMDDRKNEFYYKLSENGKDIILKANRDAGTYYLKIQNNGTVVPYNDYQIRIYADPEVNPGHSIQGISSLVGIRIDTPDQSFDVGNSYVLNASGIYSDASYRLLENVQFSSLNKQIAMINQDNTIKGFMDGYVSVVATYKRFTNKKIITIGKPVENIDDPEINVNQQKHGTLILLAGGGITDQTNRTFRNIQDLCDLVYRRFQHRFFSNEDIYYINPVSTGHDLDGDGFDNGIVDDSSPSIDSLEKAVNIWAKDQKTQGPLYLYLIGQGTPDQFLITPDEILPSAKLDEILDVFQNCTGRQVIVFFEACYSGSFINDLVVSGENRIVVTSTDDQTNTYMEYADSFCMYFTEGLLYNKSIFDSWKYARDILLTHNIVLANMNPLLDEGIPVSSPKIFVGGNFNLPNMSPIFTAYSNDISITANTTQIFYAEISNFKEIDSVWAIVEPPDYQLSQENDQFITQSSELPSFQLLDDDMDGRYEGTYNDFKYHEDYRMLIYAKNSDGDISASPTIIIDVINGEKLLKAPDLYKTSNDTDFFQKPTFNWKNVRAAQTYTLQYSDHKDFTNVNEVRDIAQTQYTIPNASSLTQGKWYWRVKSIDSNGNESDFSLPNTAMLQQYTYSWYTGEWNFCYEGRQTRQIYCLQNESKIVDDILCESPKPVSQQTCFNYYWITSAWGDCINGVQERVVSCQRSDNEIVDDHYCIATQPASEQSCTQTGTDDNKDDKSNCFITILKYH